MADLKGHHIIDMVITSLNPYEKDPAALHELAPETTKQHVSLLNKLQERIRNSPQLQKAPIADAILHHVTHMSAEARIPWKPATHFRVLTAYAGAMSSIGKYALNFQGRVDLSQAPVWRAALRTWAHLARETGPINQAAATAEDVQKALDLQTDPEIRIFLMLLWLMAGRKGDVAKIRTNNIKLLPSGRLQVFVQEGKGVKVRQGMYHVVTHCPTAWSKELATFLAAAQNPHLFRITLGKTTEVLQAIRRADPELSIRAIRRGSAQAMARDPNVTEETIMKITGHRNVKTLHRYLGWDLTNERAHLAAQTAARNNLAPPAPPAQF